MDLELGVSAGTAAGVGHKKSKHHSKDRIGIGYHSKNKKKSKHSKPILDRFYSAQSDNDPYNNTI
jgi:hypothetical protein